MYSNRKPEVVIFGCGNPLLGDDGFGPAVIEMLGLERNLPECAQCVDAGTGIREYLFDYLLAEEIRPALVVVVDSVDFPGRDPGEVFTIDPGEVPPTKIHDFSLHQFPTVNMLHELEEHTDVVVIIVAAQIGEPVDSLHQGLSPVMARAVPPACRLVGDLVSSYLKGI